MHEYYATALLAFFTVSATQHFSTELPRSKYSEYVSENRRYEGSRQFALMRACMDRFDADDVKGLTAALFAYNKVKELDEQSSRCFLRIKQALKAGPQEQRGGGQAGAAGGDEEDYR